MKKLLFIALLLMGIYAQSQSYVGYQRHGKKSSADITSIDISDQRYVYTAIDTTLQIEVINWGSGWVPRMSAGSALTGNEPVFDGWDKSDANDIETTGDQTKTGNLTISDGVNRSLEITPQNFTIEDVATNGTGLQIEEDSFGYRLNLKSRTDGWFSFAEFNAYDDFEAVKVFWQGGTQTYFTKYILNVAPQFPERGHLYFDATADTFRQYTSTGWENLGGTSSGTNIDAFTVQSSLTDGYIFQSSDLGNGRSLFPFAGFSDIEVELGDIATAGQKLSIWAFDTGKVNVKLNGVSGEEVSTVDSSAPITYIYINPVIGWQAVGNEQAYTSGPAYTNLYLDRAGSEDSTSSTNISNWNGGSGTESLNTDLTHVRTGTTSLKITTNGGEDFNYFDIAGYGQSFSGQSVTWKGYMKRDPSNVGTTHSLLLYNGGTKTAIDLSGGDWVYFEFTITDPTRTYVYTTGGVFLDDMAIYVNP